MNIAKKNIIDQGKQGPVAGVPCRFRSVTPCTKALEPIVLGSSNNEEVRSFGGGPVTWGWVAGGLVQQKNSRGYYFSYIHTGTLFFPLFSRPRTELATV